MQSVSVQAIGEYELDLGTAGGIEGGEALGINGTDPFPGRRMGEVCVPGGGVCTHPEMLWCDSA
jgi:hypothetical protein